MVGGMCIVLPYGTGICCYASIYFFSILYCFCPFLSFFVFLFLIHTFLKKSVTDKSTEWSTILACVLLLLLLFFNRGNAEGTNASNILCLIFCFMSCKLVSGLILWFMETLWFDDLCA